MRTTEFHALSWIRRRSWSKLRPRSWRGSGKNAKCKSRCRMQSRTAMQIDRRKRGTKGAVVKDANVWKLFINRGASMKVWRTRNGGKKTFRPQLKGTLNQPTDTEPVMADTHSKALAWTRSQTHLETTRRSQRHSQVVGDSQRHYQLKGTRCNLVKLGKTRENPVETRTTMSNPVKIQ